MAVSRSLPLLLLCAYAAVISLANATSDPFDGICDEVCWEEQAIAQECLDSLTCDAGLSDREFLRCRSRCQRPVSLCKRRCRGWYPDAFRRCGRANTRATQTNRRMIASPSSGSPPQNTAMSSYRGRGVSRCAPRPGNMGPPPCDAGPTQSCMIWVMLTKKARLDSRKRSIITKRRTSTPKRKTKRRSKTRREKNL